MEARSITIGDKKYDLDLNIHKQLSDDRAKSFFRQLSFNHNVIVDHEFNKYSSTSPEELA